MPRANGKCPEEPQRPNLGTARWTFEPVALLYLGKVMLEALVLCLSLFGLCVLRSHPCLRICLLLRLRLCLRLRLRLRLWLWLRLRLRLRLRHWLRR